MTRASVAPRLFAASTSSLCASTRVLARTRRADGGPATEGGGRGEGGGGGAGERRPGDRGERNDEGEVARVDVRLMQERGEQDREQEKRKRQREIDEPHQHRVRAAAGVAGVEADRHANDRREHRRGQR